MGVRKIDEIKKLISHPLETHFDINDKSTELVKKEVKSELVVMDDYDAKDNEIETDYQEIMDKALTGYTQLNDLMDNVDPKFAARLSEVSAQHLNIALNAADKKAKMKAAKDKLKKPSGEKNVNNTFIFNRNDLLKELKTVNVEDIEDGEIIDGDK